MIKVSRMADYAILLVCKMSSAENKVYSAHELSTITALKITKLTKANITNSIRGVAGGYKLMMKAEDISIGDIIDIIDGQVALTVCVEEDKNHCCELESMCPSQGNWQIINNTIREALNSVSIAEMANPFVANLQYKKSMNLFTTNKRIE